jgi:Rrf2 family protein
MFKLSKKADYGLIAAAHLAHNEGVSCSSAKDIADAYGIPYPLMAKILQRLAKNGILVSQHGTRGGYYLAKPASQITAFDVIDAIDGPVRITSCVTTRGECDQSAHCIVREPLGKVNDRVIHALSEVTLSGMAGASTGLVQMEGVSL